MAPLPGVVVVTTRFELPELERRRGARIIRLDQLDSDSAIELLRTLGVQGTDCELSVLAERGGRHAKAVELIRTYVRYYGSQPAVPEGDDEAKVAAVLQAHWQALPVSVQDIAALATAFREPVSEEQLTEYLLSEPANRLVHGAWN